MPERLNHTLDRLLDGQNLTAREAGELRAALTVAELSPVRAGALLAGVRAKGVTEAELRGLAGGMPALARRPRLPTALRAIDIVGTGGDRSGSLNLSTGAALLTASCGVSVVKHGNRAISSRAGSADVLEALGLRLPLDEARAGECLAATGFTYLYAPHYHPAMKNHAPVRSALGVRTVFNILGPLTNPAEPPFHLIGAFDLPTAELIAQALAGMSIERAMVIHGAERWDESTPCGPFTLFDVRDGTVSRELRSPGDYGLAACTTADLAGGDAPHNAQPPRRELAGRERGAWRHVGRLGAAPWLPGSGAPAHPRPPPPAPAPAAVSRAPAE